MDNMQIIYLRNLKGFNVKLPHSIQFNMQRARLKENQKLFSISDNNNDFDDDLWVIFKYIDYDGKLEMARYPRTLVRIRLMSERIPPYYDLTKSDPEVACAFLEFIMNNCIDYNYYNKSYKFIGELSFLADSFRCIALLEDLVGTIIHLVDNEHSDDWINASIMLAKINGYNEIKEKVFSQLSDEFLTLNKEILVDAKLLRQLINRCDLNVLDESEVLLFLIEWTAIHQPHMDEFGLLLSAIRKHLIEDEICYSILYGMGDSSNIIEYKRELSKWIVEGCHNFICWSSKHVMEDRPRCKAPIKRSNRRSLAQFPPRNQFELELDTSLYSNRMTIAPNELPGPSYFVHNSTSNSNKKSRRTSVGNLARDTKRIVAAKIRQVLNKIDN